MNRCDKKDKVIIIVGLILLISNPGLANHNRKLSLPEAINLALRENLDLKIANFNLNNQQINYKIGKSNNISTSSHSEKLENKLKLSQSEETYLDRKNKVILKVVNQYFQLLQKRLSIKVKQKKSKLKTNELENTKIQVKRGNKRQIKLLEKQSEYNSAQSELKKIKDEYKLLLQEFKSNLRLKNNYIVQLIKINAPQIWEIKKEKIIKDSKKNSLSLKIKKQQIKVIKAKLSKAKITNTPKLSMKKIKNNKQLAKFNYQKIKRNLEESINKRYKIFKQAIENLNLKHQYLKQITENYQIIQEYQQTGLKSKNDLLESEINLLQAKYNYQVAITNYYVTTLELQKEMGLKIEVTINEVLPKE